MHTHVNVYRVAVCAYLLFVYIHVGMRACVCMCVYVWRPTHSLAHRYTRCAI